MLGSPAHIKDVDGYIFFSPRTQGFTGRPVKIHTGLFLDFLCAVDPSTADGQTIIRDIEGLKATAHNNGNAAPVKPAGGRNDSPAHKARLDKAYDAIARLQRQRHMTRENALITKNVRVYYHIHQKAFDQYPTVYISEIQVRRESVDAGGFYESGDVMFGGLPVKAKRCDLNEKTVYISAAAGQVKTAMANAKAATGKAKPTLFFTPASAAEDLTVWKENRLTGGTRSLVDELQKSIRDNQKSRVNWIVEGEGAALLSHAVQGLSGSLDSHSFTFTNPKANLPKLLQALGQRKAQLDGDFINFNASARGVAFGSALAVASQKRELLEQLAALPASQSAVQPMQLAHTLLRLSLVSSIARVGDNALAQGVVATSQALRGNKKTFLEVLHAVRGV